MRAGEAWISLQPRPAKCQSDRSQSSHRGIGDEAVRTLRELVPKAVRLAVFLNPIDAASAEATMRDLGISRKRYGTANSGSQCQYLPGDRWSFRPFFNQRPDALFVATQPLFTSRRVQLALLAAHHSMPAIYGVREIAEVGGLVSYGVNLSDAWRQIGIYAGRILQGRNPPICRWCSQPSTS